jgi:DNA-binding transcriptional LysR family regulator
MEVIGMDVDLKLLMILDEVYKTGSVSRAAANIGMTQPSISIALAKLRNIFNDPLSTVALSRIVATEVRTEFADRGG